jgi:hypothetical protein
MQTVRYLIENPDRQALEAIFNATSTETNDNKRLEVVVRFMGQLTTEWVLNNFGNIDTNIIMPNEPSPDSEIETFFVTVAGRHSNDYSVGGQIHRRWLLSGTTEVDGSAQATSIQYSTEDDRNYLDVTSE